MGVLLRNRVYFRVAHASLQGKRDQCSVVLTSLAPLILPALTKHRKMHRHTQHVRVNTVCSTLH